MPHINEYNGEGGGAYYYMFRTENQEVCSGAAWLADNT